MPGNDTARTQLDLRDPCPVLDEESFYRSAFKNLHATIFLPPGRPSPGCVILQELHRHIAERCVR